MIKFICFNCRKDQLGYHRPAKHYFCSMRCYAIYRKGENNPNWRGGGLKFNCIQCAKSFLIDRSSYKCKKLLGKFCSALCHSRYRSIHKMTKRQKNLAKDTLKTLRRGAALPPSKIKLNWHKIFGYDPYTFEKHIRSRFRNGMTWGNYGKWELDHIIPTFKFRFTNREDTQFKKCFALSNLRPLWKQENMMRGKQVL